MSLINLFVAARSAIARWRQRQRAYGELMALDDRSLSDIGIRRSEIAAIVDGSYDAEGRAPAATLSPWETHLAGPHRWMPPI
jgi:uncharacterized protein YjiS (DUF1127 family)